MTKASHVTVIHTDHANPNAFLQPTLFSYHVHYVAQAGLGDPSPITRYLIHLRLGGSDL